MARAVAGKPVQDGDGGAHVHGSSLQTQLSAREVTLRTIRGTRTTERVERTVASRRAPWISCVSPRPQLLQRVCSLRAPTGTDPNELTKSLPCSLQERTRRGTAQRGPHCHTHSVSLSSPGGPATGSRQVPLPCPGRPRSPYLAPGWLRDTPGPLQQHKQNRTLPAHVQDSTTA